MLSFVEEISVSLKSFISSGSISLVKAHVRKFESNFFNVSNFRRKSRTSRKHIFKKLEISLSHYMEKQLENFHMLSGEAL